LIGALAPAEAAMWRPVTQAVGIASLAALLGGAAFFSCVDDGGERTGKPPAAKADLDDLIAYLESL
jgi:hypothetical protein